MIINKRFENVPIDDIRPHPKNPRKGDIPLILESIDSNGFYGAVVVQESTGYILAGNHRWKAAKESGMRFIPAIFIDCTDEQALRILLADNKTSDVAVYDDLVLAELLRSFDDLAGTGYTLKDVDALTRSLRNEKREPPEEADTDPAEDIQERRQVQLGDIYRIGPHTLVCGDSGQQITAIAALGENRPSLIWTDPPYGVDFAGQTEFRKQFGKARASGEIAGDKIDAGNVFSILSLALEAVKPSMIPGSAIYCCSAPGQFMFPVVDAIMQSGWAYKSMLVWVKNHLVLGRADYQGKYEVIHYGWLENAAHRWYGGRDKTTVIEIAKPHVSKEHPTMKPVELVMQGIENSTLEGEYVYDPFLGSGSTMVACNALDRKCIGIEIEPKFAAVCLERMENLGVPAELVHRDGDGLFSELNEKQAIRDGQTTALPS